MNEAIVLTIYELPLIALDVIDGPTGSSSFTPLSSLRGAIVVIFLLVVLFLVALIIFVAIVVSYSVQVVTLIQLTTLGAKSILTIYF